MSRSPKKVFSKTYNTKARGSLIDQDYIDQLSSEELEWLAKFTDEYYGASFSKNPGYILKKELLPIIEAEIDKAKDEKAFNKWNKHLERVTNTKEKYIQVSENDKKSHNIDLRKCRSVDIYYKNEKGNMSKKQKYKYTDDNIIDPNDPKALDECNKRVYAQKACLLNSRDQINSEYLDVEGMKEVIGVEDYFLLNEYLDEYEKIEGKKVLPKSKKDVE